MANSIIRDKATELDRNRSCDAPSLLMEHRMLAGPNRNQSAFATLTTVPFLLSQVANDTLSCLNLSLDGLRGQTCDGAADMSRRLAGAKAFLTQAQPLWYAVGPHCVHWMTQAAGAASCGVCDILQGVHELGRLFEPEFFKVLETVYVQFRAVSAKTGASDVGE